MAPNLAALEKAHLAVLEYEASRPARGEEELTVMLPILRGHQDAWLQNGGKAADFKLAQLLADCEKAAEAMEQRAPPDGRAPAAANRPEAPAKDPPESGEKTRAAGNGETSETDPPPGAGRTGSSKKRG